jgi:hypothetical protein
VKLAAREAETAQALSCKDVKVAENVEYRIWVRPAELVHDPYSVAKPFVKAERCGDRDARRAAQPSRSLMRAETIERHPVGYDPDGLARRIGPVEAQVLVTRKRALID